MKDSDDKEDNVKALAQKFDIPLPETAENIKLNFRMPNGDLISNVFPRSYTLSVSRILVIQL